MAAEQTHCCYEERFSKLESDVTELRARMDNKKEDIHSINEELSHDRQQQIELIEKVTEVTVLLKAGQDQREQNNKKFEALENKVDKLQEELTDTKQQVTDLVSSQRSFRNTVLAAIPVTAILVTILLHYI